MKTAKNESFKVLPGFNGKYEISAEGIVRNVVTKKTTKPHHITRCAGPVYNLVSYKDGYKTDARIPIIKVVFELFKKRLADYPNINPESIISY